MLGSCDAAHETRSGAGALQNLGAGPHHALEILHHTLGVAYQRHVRQHAHRKAQLLAVHQRDAGAQDAGILQRLQTPPHGRGRQAHGLGQLLDGEGGIALQALDHSAAGSRRRHHR
jgi:hypothetical protein